MQTLANPARSSIAASAVLSSDFQEAMSRVQTREVAWPKSPYAVSEICVAECDGCLLIHQHLQAVGKASELGLQQF